MDSAALHNVMLWALGDLGVEPALNDIRDRLERLAPDAWQEGFAMPDMQFASSAQVAPLASMDSVRICAKPEDVPAPIGFDVIGPWEPLDRDHYRRPLRKKPC